MANWGPCGDGEAVGALVGALDVGALVSEIVGGLVVGPNVGTFVGLDDMSIEGIDEGCSDKRSNNNVV